MKRAVAGILWINTAKRRGPHFAYDLRSGLRGARNMDYQKLWLGTGVKDPRGWPTWEFLKEYLADGGSFLEIGPGCHPRILIEGSHFIDVSRAAVEKLNEAGGRALVGRAEALPYRSASFNLVCAFDLLEHVEEDEEAFAEISRVLKRSGTFVFSVPLQHRYWSFLDDFMGHERRYHPRDLGSLLTQTGFEVEGFFCPDNLFAYVVKRRVLRLVDWLGSLLDLASTFLPPAWLAQLYNLYTLSPFSRVRGADSVSWERGDFGGVEDCSDVTVVCRKRTD